MDVMRILDEDNLSCSTDLIAGLVSGWLAVIHTYLYYFRLLHCRRKHCYRSVGVSVRFSVWL